MSMLNDAMPGTTTGKKMWKVLSPIQSKDGLKTFWMKLGIAYTNKDGSINLFIDAWPVKEGRLQLRDYDEPDRREGMGAGGGTTGRYGYGSGGGGGGGAAGGSGGDDDAARGATAAAEALGRSLGSSHTASGDIPF